MDLTDPPIIFTTLALGKSLAPQKKGIGTFYIIYIWLY